MLNNSSVIRSLLIPTKCGKLLLPSTVIAEVTGYTNPQPLETGQPKWLLGLIDWRNQRVPLLAIEEALSLPLLSSQIEEGPRIIVLYGLEATPVLPFYAIMATHIPRKLGVTEGSLLNPTEQRKPGVVFKVEISKDEVALLPDLVHLETLVRKLLPSLSKPH